MSTLQDFAQEIALLDAEHCITWALKTFGVSRIALASSFSIEDQAITDMLVQADPQCRIFTLDTGRHFQETYDVWQQSVNFWKVSYEIAALDPKELANLVHVNGPNLFYTSIEARKSCCAVRKTHPLEKVLKTVDAWIVGLRGEQSVTRAGLAPVEWDAVHGIYRISPLYNWSETKTLEYIHNRKLPVNALYEKGFRSIGCAPCTRAIGPNEDVRAGRWWWEEPEHKECGLHTRK